MLRSLLLVVLGLLMWGAEPTPADTPSTEPSAVATVEAAEVEATDAETTQTDSTEPTTPATWTKAGLVIIEGMIDDGRAAYFRRSLERASAENVDLLVVHLSTDGGYLHSAITFVETALEEARTRKVRMVALVEGKAWSAGALIAYAHHEVYITPGSHIGDIGIISRNSDGEITYAPEKIETVVRAHMRSISEANGWDMAKLVKMTARNQDLYRFTLADGTQRFVIEDDLDTFRADHDETVRATQTRVLGHDRLISYTAQEAVREQMATAIMADLPALWAHLGVDPDTVVDLKPTPTEKLSWLLASFAPLLASLAVLFIILEMKTPGVGIFAILALVCGLGFFVCQYYLDLANALELILVVIGVLIIVVDLFLLPTGGILAIIGATMALSGLLLAFMPDDIQFSPSAEGFGDALGTALKDSLLSLAVFTGGLVWIIRFLPQSRAVARIAAMGEITATSAGTLEQTAATLVGRTATVHSDLRPSGSILLDGDTVSATSEHGTYIQAGAMVTIIAMRYGEAIVRPHVTTPAGGTV